HDAIDKHRSRQQPPSRRHLHPFPTRRSSDLVLRVRWLPPRLALGNLRVAQLRSERPAVYIDFDDVAVAEESDRPARHRFRGDVRSEEHTSELQSRFDLVCRLLLEKKNRDNRS